MKKIPFWWLFLILLFLDQLTKILVRYFLYPGQIIKLTDKFIWITYVQNTGAAFSLSLGNPSRDKILFTAINIIAIIIITFLFFRSRSRIDQLFFILILVGAWGNFIDRIIFGSVTDFIWCDFPDFFMERWPVFNIADSSIVVAMSLMVIHILFFKKPVEDK